MKHGTKYVRHAGRRLNLGQWADQFGMSRKAFYDYTARLGPREAVIHMCAKKGFYIRNFLYKHAPP